MITAIPMKSDRISGHFTKAPEMLLLDSDGNTIERFNNPANESGCDGKEKLLGLLAEKHVQRVVVRHIGEQMLARLLNNNLAVFQVESQRFVNDALSNPEAYGMLPLTNAEQGRESVNHTKKMAEGGCCRHGHDSQAAEESRGSCCQGSSSGQQNTDGKHSCCHH